MFPSQEVNKCFFMKIFHEKNNSKNCITFIVKYVFGEITTESFSILKKILLFFLRCLKLRRECDWKEFNEDEEYYNKINFNKKNKLIFTHISKNCTKV